MDKAKLFSMLWDQKRNLSELSVCTSIPLSRLSRIANGWCPASEGELMRIVHALRCRPEDLGIVGGAK